jgi:hypothetical protein
MTGELLDIVQTLGSLVSVVLIPIWKSLDGLRKGQEKTNVILARDYVTKTECYARHQVIHEDMTRAHERMDEMLNQQ